MPDHLSFLSLFLSYHPQKLQRLFFVFANFFALSLLPTEGAPSGFFFPHIFYREYFPHNSINSISSIYSRVL